MTTNTKGYLILLAIFLPIVAWLTRPSGDGLKSSTCEPDGILSRVSLSIYQDKFWRAQLDNIEQKIRDAEETRSKFADIESATESERQRKLDLYKKYRKPTPAQMEAERLRARADQIEGTEGFEFISGFYRKYLTALKNCQSKINAMLRLGH
jgi:hypothetical protein